MNLNGLINKIDLKKIFNRKTLPKLLLIFIIIETIIISFVWYNQEAKLEIISQELQIVKTEKQQVEQDLIEIYNQYDSLETDNDILNSKLKLEKERILTLINDLKNSDLDMETVDEFKQKSETLELIMNDYIMQINKLNKENLALKTENEIVKEENQEVKTENKDLLKKVNIAKNLQINNVNVEVLNKRNKPTNIAKKVFKIKVCFTIIENKIVSKGNKSIYIRITDPNGYTFINEKSNVFKFNRNEIVYSMKKDIYYENKNEDVCMYWLSEDLLNESRHIDIQDVTDIMDMNFKIKGRYTIDIFIDGKHIVEKYFVLK